MKHFYVETLRGEPPAWGKLSEVIVGEDAALEHLDFVQRWAVERGRTVEHVRLHEVTEGERRAFFINDNGKALQAFMIRALNRASLEELEAFVEDFEAGRADLSSGCETAACSCEECVKGEDSACSPA